MLFNLFNTDDRHIYIDLNNRDERVVEIDNGVVSFNKIYLKTYLALKEKALLIHIDSHCINLVDENIDDVDYTYRSDDNHVFYTVKAGYGNGFSGKRPYSQLFGKKIVMGCDKSKCNVWPYNQKHEYINCNCRLFGIYPFLQQIVMILSTLIQRDSLSIANRAG